jgi:tol-pal system protein YbgF
MRKYIVQLSAVALFSLPLASPYAFAVSKEMVQLQTQVQQLQDMVQHLQTSNDERMGVIVNLVQQNTDNVNRMMGAINNLQTALKMENDQRGSGTAQISTQIQALNDSVDELKTRIANLTTQMQAIQNQMQNVNGGMPTQPGGTPPMNQAPGGQGPGAQGPGGQADGTAPGMPGAPGGAPTPGAPPVDQLYQSALRDYNSAKYAIAVSEFADVVHYYPQDPLAGNAQFYIGEINYRQGKYPAAVKAYDTVLEQFAGNPKAPAAELRKGQSLIEMGQKDAGVRELRTLIQRYPQTPEAQEGRSKLNGMGIRIYAAKPSAYPPTTP